MLLEQLQHVFSHGHTHLHTTRNNVCTIYIIYGRVRASAKCDFAADKQGSTPPVSMVRFPLFMVRFSATLELLLERH
jgi:hypothetical protein